MLLRPPPGNPLEAVLGDTSGGRELVRGRDELSRADILERVDGENKAEREGGKVSLGRTKGVEWGGGGGAESKTTDCVIAEVEGCGLEGCEGLG